MENYDEYLIYHSNTEYIEGSMMMTTSELRYVK